MDEIKRKARELLAAEYEKEGILNAVDPIMFAVDRAAVAAIAAALRSAQVPEWQPIETAPKGERVLVYNPLNGRKDIVNGWEDKSIFATHWMPLPAAPSA